MQGARRSWLKVVGGAITAGIGAAIAGPAAILLGAPAGRRGEAAEAVDVGAAAPLREGAPVRVPVRARRLRDAWTAFRDVTLGAAWLVRRGDEVRAFSTVCPHAGCAVDWDGTAFVCPCHDSAFDLDGARLRGPSPRGLDPLPCEVQGGRVRVSYRRFRPGVSDREPT